MHLVIQIPCYNEAQTIGDVIRHLPSEIEGVTKITVLVIDDGSNDDSDKVALEAGADQIVRHIGNRGLASAFMSGVEAALSIEADVIVNTDADGQYPGRFISALVEPIMQGKAEIVIGDRRPGFAPHFTWTKRMLQRVGSATLSFLIGRTLPDPVSGFRAFSREAAEGMIVTTDFSYTLETLIQAVQMKRSVLFVPIKAEPTPRPSRLSTSVTNFVMRSAATILRVFVLYYPLRSFGALAGAPLLFGLGLIMRFAILYYSGDGGGHVQSLVLGSLSMSLAFLLGAIGIVAESLRVNRQLLHGLHQMSRRSSQVTNRVRSSGDPFLAGAESNIWR